MATYSNLFVDQGSDYTYAVDLSSIVPAFEQDLNNYTARGAIKRNYASSVSVTFDITVNVNENTLEMSLPASVTQSMKSTRYVYDVELVSNDEPALVTRVLEGQLEVTPSVTSG